MSEQSNLASLELPALLRAALYRALADRELAVNELAEAWAEISRLKDLVAAYKDVIREMQETELCHECECMKFGCR